MRRFLLILISLIFMLTGCSFEKGYAVRDIYAMNTVISLNIPQNTKNAEELLSKAEELIYFYENSLSVTKKESEVIII